MRTCEGKKWCLKGSHISSVSNFIHCTSDSFSDSSLRQGAEGAGSDWVDGRTQSPV